jgi:phage N-6-adenine-methyltransferase
VNNALFSKESDEWQTPIAIFAKFDREFDFQLDVAATKDNAKCVRFFDKAANGLNQDWAARNWCNPPYSQIKKCLKGAARAIARKPHRYDYSSADGYSVVSWQHLQYAER